MIPAGLAARTRGSAKAKRSDAKQTIFARYAELKDDSCTTDLKYIISERFATILSLFSIISILYVCAQAVIT